MNFNPLKETLTRQEYFPALTGVRALAAYLVFVHHLPLVGKYGGLVDLVVKGGTTGVAIFFILSGFLISYRYADSFQKGTVRFSHYMIRRFARIYPLYLVITIFVLIWKNDFSGWHWFLNLTLLKAFFEDEIFTGVNQGWSLTVEESFYLSAPLLFFCFRKFKISTSIVLLLAGTVLVFVCQHLGSGSFMKSFELMVNSTLFGRSFEFYCGFKLAEFVKRKPEMSKPGIKNTTLGFILTLFSIMFLGLIKAPVYNFNFPVPTAILVNNYLFPFAVTLWFYGLISEKTQLSNLLSTRLFQLLGKGSYAFYLMHLDWFPEAIYFHIYPGFLSVFIFLNIWAVGVYYFFEEPLNQFIRKKFTSWKPQVKSITS